MRPAQGAAITAHSGIPRDTARTLTVQRTEHEVKQLERIFKETNARELGERHSREDDKVNVNVGLAPCYGTLRKDHKGMDDKLAVMVAEIVNLLDEAQTRGEKLDWDTVQSIFMQSKSMVPPCKEDTVENYRNFSERNTKLFNHKGRSSAPIEAVCHEIEGWFNELIQDKNVLDFTILKGLSGVKDIVARHGVSQKKRGSWNKVFLDIGVLRFPDMENPFVRVYRIRLTAWATCKKNLSFIEKNRNGITGEYHSCVYKPRRELIAELSQKARDDAKRKLESFFS
ncbi:hypothetical protein EST38_g7315 [Candolleomyces aberdarensis]|uniref:Uncharacterized protein n=1 Tax=Candolleomyces aberdarensis TaxID=2316362 RepID=A0A4Q2DFX0_9AGAR|nr:hypothetical protein EST38_g7315 [Candolleomyces aberdarensis]